MVIFVIREIYVIFIILANYDIFVILEICGIFVILENYDIFFKTDSL
jgi:hypothetical protein